MSGLGPETYVALFLINTHFFNDLCSCWDIFVFLPELYDLNWGFEQLGSSPCIIEISYAIQLEPTRFPGCTVGVGGARHYELLSRARPCELRGRACHYDLLAGARQSEL